MKNTPLDTLSHETELSNGNVSHVNIDESALKGPLSTHEYETKRFYSHWETLRPHLTSQLNRGVSTPEFWKVELDDPISGRIHEVGVFHARDNTDRLIILIHGLGSNPSAGYVRRATDAFMDMGYAVLRLSFRGATGDTPDFYNAALTAGLHAALADERITRYQKRYIMGFSLGGHMALRYATEVHGDAAIKVAAICPPLSLEGCQINLDRAPINLYRRHCLKGLRRTVRIAEMQAQERGRSLGIDVSRLDAIQTFREWDGYVVATRFGYTDAADYYARASAGPVLDQLKIPALVVATRYDPMVPIETIKPYTDVGQVTAIISDRGGHVGFPKDLDLGFGPKRGLEAQICGWLEDG